MKSAGEFYCGLGHSYERIQNQSWYISHLALNCAIEIDLFLTGQQEDFSNIEELSSILEKYQLSDVDTFLTQPHFSYTPLWRACRKTGQKELRWLSELALEMRLLRS